jgi:glycosyltransferase involved in cell wall biosynthesis
MDGQVSVSGVITAYDRPDFLRGAIESALEQTWPLCELIVVDDGSPSDLLEVVAPFGERVRYLRLSGNQGANAARNAGIAAAGGDAVALLDDDDRWLPDKVSRQVSRLAAGYEAVLCGWRASDGGETRIHPVDEVTGDMLRRGNPYCGTSGLLARREALLAVPFDVSLPKSQEWDVYVRLAQRRPLAYVRAPLYVRDTGDHARITLKARQYTPQELLDRARAVRKHRAWLGERHYREQLAAKLLDHIGQRPAKHRYLVHAIRHAGLPATTAHLLHKVVERLRP